MLEDRLKLDPSQTQNYTTALLTSHGFIGLFSAPIIAHIAEKTRSQKTPLLFGLAGCFVGTLMLAFARSVRVLFIGRILQSLAGTATWVVGFALLANNVDKKHLGKSIGMAMSFVTAGMVAGPTVSGALLQLFGYWTAWTFPLVVLVLDIIARLVMIEPGLRSDKSDAASKSPDASSPNEETPDESTALLPDASLDSCPPEIKQDLKRKYYKAILSDPRVLTALANVGFVSLLMAGISNTLPVHLREAFGWKSLLISLMFFSLQVPNIVLSGPAGWLRDHIGLRGPTVFGWATMIPLVILMGMPGEPSFPWAGGDAAGKSIFTASLFSLGCILPFVRGVGAVQLAYVVKDLEADDPIVFESSRSNLRVFSMTEVAYSLGMMIGPLLTGSLFETVGFFYMTVALATLCFIQAALSWFYLDVSPPPHDHLDGQEDA
ncbi:Tetracycline resistance protein TetA/multidrug resistance protein MdtG [Penicillium sp. DV-2018c]|nr:Tetracycline resistance protein TetA/multidrug resistance protein MdtG [Penicillium sp. DV-2018c]